MRPGRGKDTEDGSECPYKVPTASLCVLALSLFAMLQHAAGRTLSDKTRGAECPHRSPSASLRSAPRHCPVYGVHRHHGRPGYPWRFVPVWTGYIEQKLFKGGQVIKAGERMYLLDQSTFARGAEGEAPWTRPKADAVRQGGGVSAPVAAGAESRRAD